MARKYEEPKAKPSNDAYTGMLVVSFVALLIGCGLMYMDYSQYDNKPPPKMQREERALRPSPENEPRKQKTDTDEGKDTAPDEKDTKDTQKDKDTEKKDTAKDTEK
jgi:hypothetical protein